LADSLRHLLGLREGGKVMINFAVSTHHIMQIYWIHASQEYLYSWQPSLYGSTFYGLEFILTIQ
jgi:hypothetical protein